MKKKILFIEDEARFQSNFKEFFEKHGFVMSSAYDGESGAKMVGEVMPDLILLDLVLPKKNGFEVLQEIKNNSISAGIPVIVLTNLEGVHDIGQAMSLGANAYIIKADYSLDDILSRINKMLNI